MWTASSCTIAQAADGLEELSRERRTGLAPPSSAILRATNPG